MHTNAIQSVVEAFSTADPNKVWTPNELADWVGIGGFGPLFVGGPETVADLLQEWVEETDVDGFNLAYALTHETFIDAVELLVPELQKRGCTRPTMRRGPCARSCLGKERGCRIFIRERVIGIWRHCTSKRRKWCLPRRLHYI
ncbi:hypothetical protein PS880_04798 [Pseudomonas fluorescens]|uniref:Uncharacterized protein n=1 Tax=Pseudomonas fluorescens TaxID=294 RepID=A0A5E7NRX1_PSEFL|nr:hypothetical protein PS880_04798 [Pseudomonas fluorescens]